MRTVARPMTEKQALSAAVKRWGKHGCVRFNPKAATQADRDALPRLTPDQVRALTKEQRAERTGILHGYRCTVGKIVGIGIFPMFEVRGQGDSWEAAFAEADENDKRDRERWEKIRAEQAGAK